jgi:hypothetical protein
MILELGPYLHARLGSVDSETSRLTIKYPNTPENERKILHILSEILRPATPLDTSPACDHATRGGAK